MATYRVVAQLFRELADAFEDMGNDATSAEAEPYAPVDHDAPDDPWADNSQQSQPQRSQPRQDNNSGGNHQSSGSAGRSGPPTQGTFTDDRGKTWTFGKHGAKPCDHNMPAALVSGEKNGKVWRAWACPLGYGATWRDKCDMFDFTR